MEYRLADKMARPMGKKELVRFLDGPHVMRLAFIHHEDGSPAVHPVWYHYEDGKFFIAVDRDGDKAKSLRKNPLSYFLIDSDPVDGPPLGVRGKAEAQVIDDPKYATAVTVRNIVRYMGSLESEAAKKIKESGHSSSGVVLTPIYMATWKF